MEIKNGLVFCEDGKFRRKNIYTCGEFIAEPPGDDKEGIDAAGCIVSPGFIDIHIHGAAGADFSDASTEACEAIAKYLASEGVTGFLGTTMARPESELCKMMTEACRFMDHPVQGHAVMYGINLEGPFSCKEKKGAMREDMLRYPEISFVDKLNALCGGRLIFADVAPELPDAMQFIRVAAEKYVVSIAHTNADYDTAADAFRNGASHVTHLYNAMSPFDHRSPGVPGAAMDFAEDVELISDGTHVHPAVIRATFQMFGEDRVCLISDAMRACGMPDGEYDLGGQTVHVMGGRATLRNGTIAGSITPLSECFRRAVKCFSVPLEAALKAVTINPARAAGLQDLTGSISTGKRADLTFLDQDTLEVRGCMIGGRMVRYEKPDI